MTTLTVLFALFLNPVPPCCDASGSWCASDYTPAVIAGKCVNLDKTIEQVKAPK